MNRRRADVTFTPDPDSMELPPTYVIVTNVPWDTPNDQTESEIIATAIKNAKHILRGIE